MGGAWPRVAREGSEYMTAQLIGAIVLWLIVAIVAIAIVVYLVNWLYRRSSRRCRSSARVSWASGW